MDITILFFAGFLASFLATSPPGLLNMNAAKISIKEGSVRAILFSLGVCFTVVFQTYLAVIFARYLNNHPDVIEILKRIGFVIFLLISIYFLFIAGTSGEIKVKPTLRSKRSHFFNGTMLAALNFLPIPFHAYISITLAVYGYLNFDQIGIVSYVSGGTMGTFAMLYIYVFFFNRLNIKRSALSGNMNVIIGGVTLIVAIFTLVKLITG
ncbi:lysine transporter LysE [Gangjinia marincola]|uniref:Lysine transporter LysE n=1 Tax=Gangjinia marincola TaxID=578463 RepID=A0ABP3XVT3_9FLAO